MFDRSTASRNQTGVAPQFPGQTTAYPLGVRQGRLAGVQEAGNCRANGNLRERCKCQVATLYNEMLTKKSVFGIFLSKIYVWSPVLVVGRAVIFSSALA